ncbi:MAG: HAMP domain-containing sensor histidine kinase [Niabella sp.]
MKAKQKYRLKYALRLVVLFASLFLTAWFFIRGQYMVASLLFVLSVWQCYIFYDKALLPFKELDNFASAVRYRDFSRHFNAGNAPAELQALRQDFNTISQTFKSITREKEAQYQYLQKILELIQTGILLYEEENHKVIWANESLKRITQIPYIPTLHLLERKNEALYNAIIDLEPGSNNVLLLDGEQIKIMLSATSFQTEGKNYKLVALQNINEALDENEARSWKKLLSVMTHEIMNSVAPIASLAETLKQQLQSDPETGGPLKEDIALGIETIQRRSEGLLQFAASYRTLNKITASHKQDILIGGMFENIIQLLLPKLEQRGIIADIILKDPLLTLSADRHLVEQVIINLLLNAIDALKATRQPKIGLSAYRSNDSRIVVTVSDNGAGIEPDVLEKIFIPFFSTKANGNGIGLSLCKQIMLLHKGNIYVKSAQGMGTVFYLQF